MSDNNEWTIDQNGMSYAEYNSTEPYEPSQITFSPSKDSESWVMKITKEGIKFNRESYPLVEADEFAQAVIHILETCFDVSFTKREKDECK